MKVVGHINLVQLVVPDVLVCEYVAHFLYLSMEIKPLLRVILDKHIVACLLGDDDKCADVSIFPALKVAEIAL